MKRGDVDTRSPNLVVRFNEQRFSESEIRALLDIHGKVESSSEKELEQAFDTLESLVVMAEDDAREVRETTGEAVVEVHYHYQPNPRSWIMTYGLTSNGRIIRLAEG